jgi:hypothetical protein
MSIYCVGLCLNCQTKLTTTRKLILIALAEKADNDGRNAFPSVATLARYAECDERTVQRSLRLLEKEGWIVCESPARRNRPRNYTLMVDKLEGRRIVTPTIKGGANDPVRVTPVSGQGDTAMPPDPSINRPDPPVSVNGLHVHTFIQWWVGMYTEKMRGTPYQMNRARDITIIKRLLKSYGIDRLKLMAEVLLVTDDKFVSSTDRGLPILSAKSMWLDHLLRQHGR